MVCTGGGTNPRNSALNVYALSYVFEDWNPNPLLFFTLLARHSIQCIQLVSTGSNTIEQGVEGSPLMKANLSHNFFFKENRWRQGKLSTFCFSHLTGRGDTLVLVLVFESYCSLPTDVTNERYELGRLEPYPAPCSG